MVIVVMGVSGSGKTTVGRLLAERLRCPFYDGDDYHPVENVAKMQRGEALTDEDREPWLKRLRDVAGRHCGPGVSAVIACSALRAAYRQLLGEEVHAEEGARRGEENCVRFVYLKGKLSTIRQRMLQREDHFMKANMLESQYACLEEPESAIVVGVEQTPAAIAEEVTKQLRWPRDGLGRGER